MENKLKKLLKLIQDGGEEDNSIGNSNRESELFDAFKDFKEQYQSLNEQYDHLSAELKEKSHDQEEKDGDLSLSSTSVSDSDHSSKEKASEGRKHRNELQKWDASTKQKFEAANDQVVADLKQRLKDAYREKEALRADMHKTLSSIDEGKKFSEDLQVRGDQLKDKNSTLRVENGALKQELEALKGDVSDLKQRLEFTNERAADLTQGLGSAQEENMALVSKNVEISNTMEQEQRIIQALLSELASLQTQKKEGDVSALPKELDSLHTKENQLDLQIEKKNQESSEYEKIENLYLEKDHLAVQVTDLLPEVNSLLAQKGELEEQIKIKSHEAQELREENQALQLMRTKFQDQILDLKKLSNLVKKFEDNKNERSAKIMAFLAKVNDVQVELGSLHSQKRQLELQIAGRQTQMENLDIELTRKFSSDQQKFLKEQEHRIKKLTVEYKQFEDLYQESLENREVVQKQIEDLQERLRNIDYRDELINVLQGMAEKLKKEGEIGRKVTTSLKTVLSKMEEMHKDLQESLQSTELDKAVATVEKEHQTIETLRRIQEELQGVFGRLQDENKKVKQKLLRSVAELEKKARKLENRLKEKEDEVLSKEEEKKEVIRQLCITIKYHLDQIDYLKELFIKTRIFVLLSLSRKRSCPRKMENKVKKLLKLIQDGGEEDNSIGSSNRESELFDAFKDFKEQYRSLNEQYDHLTVMFKEKSHNQDEKDGDLSPSSSSVSDSDHSSKEKASENRKLRNELQKWDESTQQKLEATNDQAVANLKQRLEDSYRENEALRADMHKALSSIDEGKKFSEELQVRGDQLKDENSTLWVENGALKQELEALKGVVSDLKQRLEFSNERAADLTQGLGSAQEENMALVSKNVEISNTMEQEQRIIRELTEKVKRVTERSNESEAELHEFENEASARVKGLGADLTALLSELASLQTQKKEGEVSALHKELDSLHTKENQLDLQIEKKNQESSEYEKIENLYLEKDHLAVQVTDLRPEVNSLLAQKGELEEQIKVKSHEAQELREENQALQLMRTKFQDQILDLKRILSERADELSILLKKLEDNKNEGSAEIMTLLVQVKDLRVELDSLHSQKSQLDLQIAERQTQVENMNIELTWKVSSDQLKFLKEQEDRIKKLNTEYKQFEDLYQESLENREVVQKMIEDLHEKLRNIDYRDEMINVSQGMAGKLKKEVEIGRKVITSLKTVLSKMEEIHKDLQERLQSTELDKAVATIEKECQTIETLQRIQEKHQGEIARLQDENKKVNEKLLKSVAGLKKKGRELENRLKEKEDEVLSKEEEKKEVIRQLCITIKYHLDQIDYLKELFIWTRMDLSIALKMENKLKKLLKLIQDGGEEDNSIGNSNRESELFDAFKDFKEQCQSLNEQYDHLIAELKEISHDQDEKDGHLSPSSSSVSDSDHSFKEKASENRKHRNELQKWDESTKQKLEAANDEGKKFSEDLQVRGDQLKDENSTLWVENGALKQELEALKGDELDSLHEKIENLSLEKDNLAVQVTNLRPEVNSLLAQKGELEEKIKIKSHEAQELREENQALQLTRTRFQNKILVLERILSVRGGELSSLLKKLEDNKNEGSAQIRALKAQVNDLQEKERQTIETLQRIQEELQGEIAMLQDENKKVKEKLLRSVAELKKKARELENRLKEKEDEVLSKEEEKKEVIRQLCITIKYHLDQIDYLKELFIWTRMDLSIDLSTQKLAK
ncbi:COP1-interactive protein 1-like [Telopea speciosissima]|uniref:COP1-interactive protein 1-like n=1 Tax=Telopea speciosissima TaxID=54955 RepID=UPI001CC4B617|nr:COP1-interactive protein 1-like [Telopea speciosissima]